MSNGKVLNSNKYVGILDNIFNTIIHVGVVKDIDDPNNEGRIKVYIPSLDKNNKVSNVDEVRKNNKKNNKFFRVLGLSEKQEINNPNTEKTLNNSIKNTDSSVETQTEIPWSIPLLPKHLQIMPKVGEKVKVILFDMGNSQSDRAWIGPLSSQKTKLNFEDGVTSGNILNSSRLTVSLKNVSGNNKKLRTGNKKIGGFTGGFPDKSDIALMGRNNADIVLPSKDGFSKLNAGGEILLRVGKFKFNSGDDLELNINNPGYFRLKVVDEKIGNQTILQKTRSMLFSDYISLISYNNDVNGKPYVTPINPILGTDTELKTVHDSLSPLIRGDVLVEFLELIRDFVKNHNHPYHKLPPTNVNSKDKIEEFDLQRLLSLGIRIN
jgi:hypothetical protein